ncbi:UNVERIFIED_ORG: hypothetical protein ABID57_000717 [Arthrobacter sp. UYEF1]
MNPDNQRHKAIKLADGSTALVSDTAGFALEIVGAIEVIAVTDNIEWADMHKNLQTGKLDFATVKKEQDISRKSK